MSRDMNDLPFIYLEGKGGTGLFIESCGRVLSAGFQ